AAADPRDDPCPWYPRVLRERVPDGAAAIRECLPPCPRVEGGGHGRTGRAAPGVGSARAEAAPGSARRGPRPTGATGGHHTRRGPPNHLAAAVRGGPRTERKPRSRPRPAEHVVPPAATGPAAPTRGAGGGDAQRCRFRRSVHIRALSSARRWPRRTAS